MTGDKSQPRLVAGEILAPSGGSRITSTGSAAVAGDSAAPAPASDPFLATPQMAQRSKASAPLFWATVCLAVFLAFWVSGGHRLVTEPMGAAVRSAPGHALVIRDLVSRIEGAGDSARLIVDGEVLNSGPTGLTLPDIVISVAAEDDATSRYLLGTNRTLLEPGETYAFSSRLDSPRSGVGSVTITFEEEGND